VWSKERVNESVSLALDELPESRRAMCLKKSMHLTNEKASLTKSVELHWGKASFRPMMIQ